MREWVKDIGHGRRPQAGEDDDPIENDVKIIRADSILARVGIIIGQPKEPVRVGSELGIEEMSDTQDDRKSEGEFFKVSSAPSYHEVEMAIFFFPYPSGNRQYALLARQKRLFAAIDLDEARPCYIEGAHSVRRQDLVEQAHV